MSDAVDLQIVIDSYLAGGWPAVVDLLPTAANVKLGVSFANGQRTGTYDPGGTYLNAGEVLVGVDRGDGIVGTLQPTAIGAPEIKGYYRYSIVTLEE